MKENFVGSITSNGSYKAQFKFDRSSNTDSEHFGRKKKLFGYFLSFFVGYMQENMYRQFSLYVLLIVVTLKILYKAPFGNILQIILSCLLYNCNFLGYNYICDDPTFGLGQDLRIIWFDSFFLFDLDFEVKYLG